jgi:large exoprotein involved in heme utilization and adhesion
VILKDSQILARAFAGSGGAIDVTAGLFLADPASVMDASSTLGVSGTVQINAPINNLSSVVARLPESLSAVQALLRASCAAKLAQGMTSSFVERGRDGIPAGPDGILASPYLPVTATYAMQQQADPLAQTSGVQLRRLFGHGLLSSVTLFSDRAACSS